jgi:hypothetical protein
MLFRMLSHFPLRDLALFALLLGLLGGPAFAQQSQANDDALSAESTVPGIRFVALAQLPRAPASAKSQKECDWLLIKPKTSGGKAAAALGWGVTAEVPLGAYEAVSFAGQFTPSTSSSCEIAQGNLAIFKGQQLIALAFATKGAKQSIGRVSVLQEGVRIWDGDLVASPVGDLNFLDGYLFRIGPLASEDSVCAGQGAVPNIYGKPINQARQALISKGWAPLENPRDLAADKDQYHREISLSQRGVVEVDSCSGTGFGFCGYYYRKASMELTVTTDGDDEFPSVVDYDTSCDKAHWHKPD